MTRMQIVMKAIEGKITWLAAAEACRMTARHMRRLKKRYEEHGCDGLVDYRSGRPRRKRIPVKVIQKICELKRERYSEFSTKHFHEHLVEKHGIELSYTWTLQVLRAAGLAPKADGRGQYRRKRERRPMVGMLLHQDASTHEWIQGRPMLDLVLMLDDATSEVLYGRFVEQEGTMSSLQGLEHVLRKHGRFCEFYTDRGSHYCHTSRATEGPDPEQNGVVSRALRALGIRHILARSPEARGRSERAFRTFQGRLPQELALHGIRDIAAANEYLTQIFIPDHNRRRRVQPLEPESAFVRLAGVDLRLLLSVQHDRVVRPDNTVCFERLILQLPPDRERAHFVRCPVVVHEFTDHTLGVSYQGRLLALFSRQGDLLALKQVA